MIKNIKFFKDVATLMMGTIISQLIAVFAYPILSRLYTPAEMGFFAFFVGISSMLSVVFSGRYELSIILPKSDKEADNLTALSIFFGCIMCGVSFLIIFIFHSQLLTLSKNPQLKNWLYYVPISTFFMSFCQIMDYVGTRGRSYQKLATKAVVQQLIYISFAILFGMWVYTNNGLIVARILSFAGAAVVLIWMFFDKIQMIRKNIYLQPIWEGGLRYKQFLFCNVPYSFLGIFSKEFIVFSFVIFGNSQGAGLYALARNILYIPISFLSTTLGQAFYKESVAIIGTPKLEQIVLQLINSLIIFGVPAAIFFVMWACEIFSFCFGEIWWDAGIYAAIFMPAAFLSLFTSWPERLYETTQKQHISLTIQIIFDTFSIILLWSLLTFGFSILNCILFYTILNCIYQITYLINVFKIANFDLIKLLESGSKILILTLLSLISLYFPCMIFTSLIAQFIGGVILLLMYYSFIVYLNMKPMERFQLKFLLIQ